MSSVLMTVFLLSALALIAGLIKPSLVLFGARKTRIRVLAVYGSIAFLSFVFAGAFAPPPGAHAAASALTR